MNRKTIVPIVVVGLVAAAGAQGAGSCAYEEGVIALERGQEKRAQVMLAIAAREGHLQARHLLQELHAKRVLAETRPPSGKMGRIRRHLKGAVEDRRADPAK